MVSNRLVVGSSGSVGRLELCGRDIAEVGVKALVVVPVHPSQCGQLDVGGAVPGSLVGAAACGRQPCDAPIPAHCETFPFAGPVGRWEGAVWAFRLGLAAFADR